MNWKGIPLIIAAPLTIGFGFPPLIMFQAKIMGLQVEDPTVLMSVSWSAAFLALVICGILQPHGRPILTIRDILPDEDGSEK